ncbi:hypothetical protein KFL_001730170 [Klebsormidium nitens]|uniref:Uncharacterized protein n=1 Tax=Klebsormidium nitens TaxID=105231 RepID=A0A1Y1HZE1_KLENI|nr:hypothetical protein KFL_001730170 [Klebsormidium nitens]|eukprot:GAQ84024.1 hypothetical protein KFL_001730170 [Klebsormidium nitens]
MFLLFRGRQRQSSSPHTPRTPKMQVTPMLWFVGGCLLGVFLAQPWSKLGRLDIAPEAASLEAPSQPLDPHTDFRIPPEARILPPQIVASTSDFYLRRLWGRPEEDLQGSQPRNLLVITAGIQQKENVDNMIEKFPASDFVYLIFHYDGIVEQWNTSPWFDAAIHIVGKRQSKWWFAKRFLHPDIVEPYDYIFIWDEDLGLDNFNASRYLALIKRHGLEISQPGLDAGATWMMTLMRPGQEIHKATEERPGWCKDGPLKPPCAGFVEIMAPVFSRKAWRCTWYMIQNDLIHGWGLDMALQRCAQGLAYEKIGVVDQEFIKHKSVPSLGNQGQSEDGRQPWEGVRERCQHEWGLFQARLEEADKHDPRLATPVPVVVPGHLEMSAEEKKKIVDGRFKADQAVGKRKGMSLSKIDVLIPRKGNSFIQKLKEKQASLGT